MGAQRIWARKTWVARSAGVAVALLAGSSLWPGPAASAGVAGTGAATPVQAAYQPAHPDQDFAGWSLARGSASRTIAAAAPAAAAGGPTGLDVSSWQGSVDWPAVRANGGSFAYVKATEGTGYISPTFGKQYTGSYRAGLIRGAYHFALPDASTGAAQADHFVAHGGGWSNDGMTLPGALDIEYNPYGAMCYGYSPAGMVDWIWSFVNRYQARTGRYPVIYTNRGWWNTCTGDSSAFTDTDPLWVAAYSPTTGTLPGHWLYYTFWQYANAGPFPGDQNRFNGTPDRLQALARG